MRDHPAAAKDFGLAVPPVRGGSCRTSGKKSATSPIPDDREGFVFFIGLRSTLTIFFYIELCENVPQPVYITETCWINGTFNSHRQVINLRGSLHEKSRTLSEFRVIRFDPYLPPLLNALFQRTSGFLEMCRIKREASAGWVLLSFFFRHCLFG